jgi:hypothetical protein
MWPERALYKQTMEYIACIHSDLWCNADQQYGQQWVSIQGEAVEVDKGL